MPHDAHDDAPFQPQQPASADANGVIADPAGRSPSQVDDSALRPIDESSATAQPREETSGSAEG